MDKNEVLQVLNNLVSAIYDLYPDQEYEELYGLKWKIEQANALARKLNEEITQ